MVSAVVLPLLLFLMVGATVVVAQPDDSSKKSIPLGSTLSPTIKPTSWLSPSGLFGFGFYRQGDGFAVGVWLLGHPHNIVVWTSMRDYPPVSSNATLVLTEDGMLLLRNDRGVSVGNPIESLQGDALSASMLDSGNFVIYGSSSDSEAIWESFSYPTDSILGGQNLTGSLLSSASESDRSSGRFILTVQDDGSIVSYPAYSTRSPSDSYRVTPSDSYWVTGDLRASQLSLTQTGVLYATQILANISYSISENERVVYRATLEANGMLKLYAHIFSPQNRPSYVRLRWSAPDHQCDVKGFCGFNSFCSSSREEADDANITTGGSCTCYPGFAYISPNETSQGCYRNFSDMDNYCRQKEWEGLFIVEVMSNNSWGGSAYSAVSIEEDQDCSKSCLEDCYCAAALFKSLTCYKYKLPIMYGLGNQSTWTRAFIKVVSRIPLPPTGSNTQIVVNDGKKSLILVLAVSLGSLLLLSSLVSVCVLVAYYCRARGYRKVSAQSLALTQDFGIHQFSYDELEKATCGFKEKLGRGSSSGEVYRGSLFNGRRSVAVKKLARVMREGERDFCSEMMAIGRTHHKNLVRLIGFCVDGSRKFLVYEYMSNGSLAELLFKGDGRPVWEERRRMAVDVARGIYYLHEECEARIIHCDIKAENILIDDSWTAKISDFGLAKLLPPNESGIATGIKETRGLAPEWRKNVVVSVKADIYSYGVLLLEVICCRRNMEVNASSPDEVIISTWAYQCFVDGQLEKLVGDEEVVDMQILGRMVKVALLCIQEDPDLRPPMKNVILMLEGTMNIPLPPSPFP